MDTKDAETIRRILVFREAEEIDARAAAAALGRKGGKAGTGEAKRRGDSAYYKALRAKRAGRCNYCQDSAVVQFSWTSRYSSRGHIRYMTLTARACAEHEGCVNWNALRAIHPDSPLVRH